MDQDVRDLLEDVRQLLQDAAGLGERRSAGGYGGYIDGGMRIKDRAAVLLALWDRAGVAE